MFDLVLVACLAAPSAAGHSPSALAKVIADQSSLATRTRSMFLML